MRAGEIRMDIALRSLLPEYMENINTVPIPVFPSEDMDGLEKYCAEVENIDLREDFLRIYMM